jgi:uncharacterized repeat protein (TIGR03837 family)
VWCIVPEGVATGELDRWTGGAVPHAGQVLARGRLSLAGIPFLAQNVYDRLLWACDVNLVRGEDSFVRALWAARPLIWQPYPQPDDAQLAKLDAFLARYGSGMPQPSAASFNAFQRDWNDPVEGNASVDRTWEAFAAELPATGGHARRWTAELAIQPDLAARLVRMVEGLV